MPSNRLNQPEKQLQIKMPKHTIGALFCLLLPSLVIGASLNAQVPIKLEPPVGALVNSSNHRIVGGNDANFGQFPYIVQLSHGSRFCAGSIISPEWILTAAHCFSPLPSPSSVYIRAGTRTFSAGGYMYGVSEIHVHGQFDSPQAYSNDIALLRVNGQIAYNDDVKRVPLTLLPPLLGGSLVLSGWGDTGSVSHSYILQYIETDSIGVLDCIMQLPGYPVSAVGNICTLAPVGQGACSGDSGGPLVTQDGVQVGIVSFGATPCGDGKPDVYTSVAAYRVWILALTGVLL